MGIHVLNKPRTFKRALGAALSMVLAFAGLAIMEAPASAATISNVKFGAPVHSTYDHKTGGGAYNNGATTYVKGELQGTDFACGDITSYIVVLNTDAAAAGNVTAEMVFDFTGDTTGQSGVALQPLLTSDHLMVNKGVIAKNAGTGPGGTDAAFGGAVTGSTTTAAIAASPAPTEVYVSASKPNFVSGSVHRLTYTVENLVPNSSNAFRMDARILCKAGSTPTGNEQISLKSVVVKKIGASTANETISGGNQTVNFKGVSGLAGLTVPQLSVVKTVVAATDATHPGDCANAVSLLTLSGPGWVTYCYSVTNYAAATSYSTTLKDDLANADPTDDVYIALTYGGSTKPATNGLVAPTSPDLTLPGGSAVATGSMTVNLAANGIVINTATARGTSTSAGGTVVTATATARVNVGSVTDISITKIADRTQAANGQTITYTITIKNEGTVALSGVEITDANAEITSCTSAGTITLPKIAFTNPLAVGASTTCTATHVVDTTVDAASYTNRATVTTTTGPLTKSADAPVVITVPKLTIEKEMTSAAPSLAGDIVTYNLYVNNVGTAALTSVVVTDANASFVSCTTSPTVYTAVLAGTTATFANFAIGTSATCAVTHTVTAGEASATPAQTVNTASVVSAQTTSINSNTITSPLSSAAPAPAWRITKTKTSTNTLTAIGDTITYDITVTNTGNVTLQAVTIIDTTATLSDCTSPNPDDLVVGASRTCTATHSVTDPEVTARQTVNTASVTTTTTGLGPTNSNTVTTPITPPAPPTDPTPVYHPSLSIVKSLTSAVPLKIGDVATYAIKVTNTGDIALINVTVTDANATITSCTPTIPVASLAIAGTIDCVAKHTTTAADFAAGFISNVAITQNDGGVTVTTSNEVKTPLSQEPSVKIEQKVIDPTPTPEGEKTKIEIDITNDGNVDIKDITITTDNSKILTCTPPLPVAVLHPGEKIVCIAEHKVTPQEAFTGTVENNVTFKAAGFKSPIVTATPVVIKTVEKKIIRSTAVKRILLPFTGGYIAPKATVRISDKPIPSAHGFKEGKLIATIRVARFGKTWVRKVYEGTNSERVLNRLGVGHYEETELPGELGNFAVAGHRFAYGGAFLNIDKLKAGDIATVETADAIYTYKWLQTAVVPPSAVGVVAQKPVGLKDPSNNGHYLTLTSCTPVHINTSRIAAWFALQSVDTK